MRAASAQRASDPDPAAEEELVQLRSLLLQAQEKCTAAEKLAEERLENIRDLQSSHKAVARTAEKLGGARERAQSCD